MRVGRRISAAPPDRRENLQSRLAMSDRLVIRSGELRVPPVPVEQQRRETRGPRALDVVPQRVTDVQRFGRGDAEPLAGAPEDLGRGLAGRLDRRDRDRRGKTARASGLRAARGRWESQFETTASSRPRAGELLESRQHVPVDGPGAGIPEMRGQPAEGRVGHARRRPRLRAMPVEKRPPEALLAGDPAVAVRRRARPGPAPRRARSASRERLRLTARRPRGTRARRPPRPEDPGAEAWRRRRSRRRGSPGYGRTVSRRARSPASRRRERG